MLLALSLFLLASPLRPYEHGGQQGLERSLAQQPAEVLQHSLGFLEPQTAEDWVRLQAMRRTDKRTGTHGGAQGRTQLAAQHGSERGRRSSEGRSSTR